METNKYKHGYHPHLFSSVYMNKYIGGPTHMHTIIPFIACDQWIAIEECGVATQIYNSWSSALDWAVERKGPLCKV